MAFLGRETMKLTLYEYVHVVNKVEKPLESKVVYQILIGIDKKDMKLTFVRDRSQTAMGHLHAIEDLCSLFKLASIPHD
jgi:hypothetical protein